MDYEFEQIQEIESIEAIYLDDFQQISSESESPAFTLIINPQSMSDDEIYVSITIKVSNYHIVYPCSSLLL